MADDDATLTAGETVDRPTTRRITHVIMREDHDRPVGRALCGRLVSITLHAPEAGPTCPECAAALEDRDRSR